MLSGRILLNQTNFFSNLLSQEGHSYFFGQNFSQVARKVEENGPVIILKNNKPRFILMEYNDNLPSVANDIEVTQLATKFMENYQKVFEALAK